MKQKSTHEEVMQLRALAHKKFRGEITLAEMLQRVDEISGKQLPLSPQPSALCPLLSALCSSEASR